MNKSTVFVLISTVLFMIFWLGIFKFSCSNGRARNKIAMFISSHAGIPVKYSFAVFINIFYSGMPLFACVFYSSYFGTDLLSLFKVYEGTTSRFVDTLIGVLAVMAVESALIVLFSILKPQVPIDKEIQEVGWISSILKFPGKWTLFIPCISACCEETFFRGAVLNSLTQTGMPFWQAATVVTILFMLNQMYLTEKPVQGMIIGMSSFAISVVSCLLLGATGNIMPSLVIHASFAGFYTNNK